MNPAEVTAIKAVRDGVAKPHCRNSVPADAFIRPASVREKQAQRANPAGGVVAAR